jgi:hypothetical protein
VRAVDAGAALTGATAPLVATPRLASARALMAARARGWVLIIVAPKLPEWM